MVANDLRRPLVNAMGICCAAQTMDDARRMQAGVLGVDSHNDTAQRVLIENIDLSQRLPDGMVDFPRLREGGIHVPFFALWVPGYYKGAEAVRRTLVLRDAMQGVLISIQTRSSSQPVRVTLRGSSDRRR